MFVINREVKSVCRLVYLMNLVKLEYAEAEQGRTVIEIKMPGIKKQHFEAVCERYRRSIYGFHGKVRRINDGAFEFTCREGRFPESVMDWKSNTVSLRMILRHNIEPDKITL